MKPNPDETDVTSFLCRLALNEAPPATGQQAFIERFKRSAPLPDPFQQMVATDEGQYFTAIERMYCAEVAKLKQELYVSTRMAGIYERQVLIAETAIARLQGEVASLTGTVSNLNQALIKLGARRKQVKRGWFWRWTGGRR